MKKVIVFDMDGVLFDTSAVAEQYIRERFPDMPEDIRKELLSGNFHDQIQHYAQTLPPSTETPEEREIRQAGFAARKLECGMYDGMYDLVIALHTDGYTLTMNTTALARNCLPMLEKAGLDTAFDFVATFETARSKVDKFNIIAEKYAVKNKDMLFVTDTLGDIREAEIAGVPTIAVTWGAHDMSYFTREPHTNLVAIVDTVEELESWIKK